MRFYQTLLVFFCHPFYLIKYFSSLIFIIFHFSYELLLYQWNFLHFFLLFHWNFFNLRFRLALIIFFVIIVLSFLHHSYCFHHLVWLNHLFHLILRILLLWCFNFINLFIDLLFLLLQGFQFLFSCWFSRALTFVTLLDTSKTWTTKYLFKFIQLSLHIILMLIQEIQLILNIWNLTLKHNMCRRKFGNSWSNFWINLL